jgi:hypothetical protein
MSKIESPIYPLSRIPHRKEISSRLSCSGFALWKWMNVSFKINLHTPRILTKPYLDDSTIPIKSSYQLYTVNAQQVPSTSSSAVSSTSIVV